MVCGCCGKKEELTPEDRADAEEKLEETKESYKPTGGGRLPGSKFNITGAQINDTNDKADLETLVKTAKRDQRRGGCCCLCKSETVLDKWGWIQTHAEVTTFLEKVRLNNSISPTRQPERCAPPCCTELLARVPHNYRSRSIPASTTSRSRTERRPRGAAAVASQTQPRACRTSKPRTSLPMWSQATPTCRHSECLRPRRWRG
jgi:hypothetical protein